MSSDHTHDHAQTHDHHGHAHDYAIMFDDEPLHIEFVSQIGAAMRKAYPFDPDTTTALDFACGTGLTTRTYAPYVKSVLGVDISQKMLDKYNQQAVAKGLADKMSCVCTELKGVEGELDGQKFDVVTCSMAYHHFASIEDTTRMLVKFLKPNGVLFVADIEAPPKGEETAATTEMKNLEFVAHKHGFEVDEIKTVFEGVGLDSFDMKHVAHAKFANVTFEVDVFLAKGVKVSEA